MHQPIKGQEEEGANYIWAKPVEDPGSEPRAYRLANSDKLHEQAAEALGSSRNGTRQMGTVTGRSGSGPGEQRSVFSSPRGLAEDEKGRVSMTGSGVEADRSPRDLGIGGLFRVDTMSKRGGTR